MNTEQKRTKGRPFKMQNWIIALKEVLENQSLTFLTDEDLIFLVNRTLPDEQRICKSTFEKWKAGKFAPDEAHGTEFYDCMHLALIKEKDALGEKLMNDKSGQWVRWAWILERKYIEWNLKNISENINRNEQSTVIQITAGSDEQKAKLKSIIDAEYEEVQPIKLKVKKDVEPQNNDEDEMPF